MNRDDIAREIYQLLEYLYTDKGITLKDINEIEQALSEFLNKIVDTKTGVK